MNGSVNFEDSVNVQKITLPARSAIMSLNLLLLTKSLSVGGICIRDSFLTRFLTLLGFIPNSLLFISTVFKATGDSFIISLRELSTIKN